MDHAVGWFLRKKTHVHVMFWATNSHLPKNLQQKQTQFSHRIHGTGIYLPTIHHQNPSNVGKYYYIPWMRHGFSGTTICEIPCRSTTRRNFVSSWRVWWLLHKWWEPPSRSGEPSRVEIIVKVHIHPLYIYFITIIIYNYMVFYITEIY